MPPDGIGFMPGPVIDGAGGAVSVIGAAFAL